MTNKRLLNRSCSATIIFYKGEVCRFNKNRKIPAFVFGRLPPFLLLCALPAALAKKTGKNKKTKQEVKDQ